MDMAGRRSPKVTESPRKWRRSGDEDDLRARAAHDPSDITFGSDLTPSQEAELVRLADITDHDHDLTPSKEANLARLAETADGNSARTPSQELFLQAVPADIAPLLDPEHIRQGAQLRIHRQNPEVVAAYLHGLSVRSQSPSPSPYRPSATVVQSSGVPGVRVATGSAPVGFPTPGRVTTVLPNHNVHSHPVATELRSWIARRPDIAYHPLSGVPRASPPRTPGQSVLSRPTSAPTSALKASSIYCPDRVLRPTTPAYRGLAAPARPTAPRPGTSVSFPLAPRPISRPSVSPWMTQRPVQPTARQNNVPGNQQPQHLNTIATLSTACTTGPPTPSRGNVGGPQRYAATVRPVIPVNRAARATHPTSAVGNVSVTLPKAPQTCAPSDSTEAAGKTSRLSFPTGGPIASSTAPTGPLTHRPLPLVAAIPLAPKEILPPAHVHPNISSRERVLTGDPPNSNAPTDTLEPTRYPSPHLHSSHSANVYGMIDPTDHLPVDGAIGAGLYNVAMSCHLNAMLQVTSGVVAIVQRLGQRHCNGKGRCAHHIGLGAISECLGCELLKTLRRISYGLRPYRPDPMLKFLPHLVLEQYVAGQMEDSADLLTSLLNSLWDMDPALLDKFSIIYGWDEHCECGRVHPAVDTVRHLQLALPANTARVTMNELLDRYMQDDDTDDPVECPTTGVKLHRRRRDRRFLALADVIFVQFKRFDNAGNKNHVRIDYPIVLDLQNRVHPTILGTALPDSFVYRLKGTATHVGPVIRYGHYTANTLRSNQQWRTMNDDQNMGPVKPGQPNDPDAYYAIYERVARAIVPSDFGLSSVTARNMMQADMDLLVLDVDNFGGSFHSDVILASSSSPSSQKSRPTPEDVDNLSQGLRRGLQLNGQDDGLQPVKSPPPPAEDELRPAEVEPVELSDTTVTDADVSDFADSVDGKALKVRELDDDDILQDTGCAKFDDMWKREKNGKKWDRVCAFPGCKHRCKWNKESELFLKNHWMVAHCKNKRADPPALCVLTCPRCLHHYKGLVARNNHAAQQCEAESLVPILDWEDIKLLCPMLVTYMHTVPKAGYRGGSGFQCSACPPGTDKVPKRIFTSRVQLEFHILSMHAHLQLPCPTCGFLFTARNRRNQHVKRCRATRFQQKPNDGYLRYHVPTHVLRRWYDLDKWMERTGDGTDPRGSWICQFRATNLELATCDHVARTRELLVTHMMVHHASQIGSNCQGFTCWKCRAQFQTVYSLVAHLKLPTCGVIFSLKKYLDDGERFPDVHQYLRIDSARTTIDHRQRKSHQHFKCTYKPCGFGGPRSSVLLHIARDHVSRSWPCPELGDACTIPISAASSIFAHIQRHHRQGANMANHAVQVFGANSDLATDPSECNVCSEVHDSPFDRYVQTAVKHADLAPRYVNEMLRPPGSEEYYNLKSDFALSFLKSVTEELLPRVNHNRNRIVNWNNVHAWTGIVKGVEIRVNIHLVVDMDGVLKWIFHPPAGLPQGPDLDIVPYPEARLAPTAKGAANEKETFKVYREVLMEIRDDLMRRFPDEGSSFLVLSDRASHYSSQAQRADLEQVAGCKFAWIGVDTDHPQDRTRPIQPLYSDFLNGRLVRHVDRVLESAHRDQATVYSIFHSIRVALRELTLLVREAWIQAGFSTLDYRVKTAEMMRNEMGAERYDALPHGHYFF